MVDASVRATYTFAAKLRACMVEEELVVALDVTNPEPLPPNHPLYSHPRAIITPHVSGVGENEFEIAVDVFEFNVKKLREGEGVGHPVQWLRGY